MSLLPVFLKLAGRRVLLVGDDAVATAKREMLLRFGADVAVVSPQRFQPSDLDGAWLVVAAATPEVNRAVAEAADARHVFVNAVDDPPNASAYLGGVIQRSGITIAISTNGEAPALAGLLREGIEALLPEDLERWTACAQDQRRAWKAEGVPMAARRPKLAEALKELYP
jgi:uroporphyrin-III C-methyltransferase/precorrin-2 dehydrogenase/sirohydrochlorin ferrochelatase